MDSNSMNKIYVANLPNDVYEEQAKKFFSRYGEVIDVKIIRGDDKKSKGYGFITFKEAEDAFFVRSMDISMDRRKLKIGLAYRKVPVTTGDVRSTYYNGTTFFYQDQPVYPTYPHTFDIALPLETPQHGNDWVPLIPESIPSPMQTHAFSVVPPQDSYPYEEVSESEIAPFKQLKLVDPSCNIPTLQSMCLNVISMQIGEQTIRKQITANLQPELRMAILERVVELNRTKLIDVPLLKTLWGGMRKICLPKIQFLPQNAVREALITCPKVEHLDLSSYWKVLPHTLSEIAQHCSRLTNVNLSRCALIDDEALENLCYRCPLITTLNLRRCRKITDKGAKDLGKLRGLTDLNIRGCYQISDSAFKFVTKNGQLIHLNMGWTRLSDASIKGLCDCRSLHSLNLDWNLNLSESAILSLIVCVPELQSISLKYLDISTNGMQDISRKCPKLEYINVSGCQFFDNLSLVSIRQHCPNLFNLKMSEHMRIDLGNVDTLTCSKTLTHVTMSKMPLTHAPLDRLIPQFSSHLVEINLNYASLTSILVIGMFRDHEYPNLKKLSMILPEQIDTMSDHVTCLIVSSCKSLVELNLTNWKGISNASMATIASAYTTQLFKLNVSGCVRVSDEGLYHVMASCPEIQELGIGQLTKLTHETLELIPATFKKLVKLNLSQLQVEIQLLEALATQSFNLEVLDLTLCSGISGDVMSSITVVGRFPNLRKLYLSGIEISAEFLQTLSHKRPLTRIFADALNNYLFIYPQDPVLIHTACESLTWSKIPGIFQQVPETVFVEMRELTKQFGQLGGDASPHAWAEMWSKMRECAIRFKYHLQDRYEVFLMGIRIE